MKQSIGNFENIRHLFEQYVPCGLCPNKPIKNEFFCESCKTAIAEAKARNSKEVK